MGRREGTGVNWLAQEDGEARDHDSTPLAAGFGCHHGVSVRFAVTTSVTDQRCAVHFVPSKLRKSRLPCIQLFVLT